MNGIPQARQTISADGSLSAVTLKTEIKESAWVAMRILPSSHTNPIFIHVDKKPVRQRKSLEWCLKSVDQLWKQKERFIAAEEMNDAIAAYAHAREVYRKRLAQAGVE